MCGLEMQAGVCWQRSSIRLQRFLAHRSVKRSAGTTKHEVAIQCNNPQNLKLGRLRSHTQNLPARKDDWHLLEVKRHMGGCQNYGPIFGSLL